MRRHRDSRVNGLLFSVLLAAILAIATTQNIDQKNQNKDDGSSNKRSEDLEASETSRVYSFHTANNFIHPPFQPFMIPPYPAVSFFPPASGPFSFGSSGNNNGGIHSTISCGDRYPGSCKESRLRSIDGSCNNLKYPTWGMANTRYGRLVHPNYGDGIKSPTRSVTGSELPPARLVSIVAFPNQDINDKFLTLAAMQWGQIITHDMALADGTTQSSKHQTRCCTDDGRIIPQESRSASCDPILILYNDPVYTKENVQCMEFVSTSTDIDRGCSSSKAPAEQITAVTHFLDLSIVYGSDQQTANRLRTRSGGRLNVAVRNNRHWLPPATNSSATCDIQNSQEICYDAGDIRVNQNTQLTVLQIILLREHNRIADYLAKLNPHWTDETIYQETRRILIAEHQYISYYEWLPLFLGKENSYDFKLLYNTKDYVNDYDPDVNPSVLNEHSTAAFRYFHSMIAGYLDLVNENRNFDPHNSLRLSNYFNRPMVIEQGNNMDDLTRGLASQPQKENDRYFDQEITQYLFRDMRNLGADLRATDIHRSRNHGLGSYNDLREFCGLPRAKDFNDFQDWITSENVQILSTLYKDPDDVELTVAGSLERHLQGALVGPTFECILIRQFLKTRSGDRFWFETGDPKIAFTIEQLNEIRKSSISRLLCDNGDNIQYMQPSGFMRISEDNIPMKCEDLPSIDLSFWKDYAQETQHDEQK